MAPCSGNIETSALTRGLRRHTDGLDLEKFKACGGVFLCLRFAGMNAGARHANHAQYSARDDVGNLALALGRCHGLRIMLVHGCLHSGVPELNRRPLWLPMPYKHDVRSHYRRKREFSCWVFASSASTTHRCRRRGARQTRAITRAGVSDRVERLWPRSGRSGRRGRRKRLWVGRRRDSGRAGGVCQTGYLRAENAKTPPRSLGGVSQKPQSRLLSQPAVE
jgi:hypothetical protein